MDEVITIGRQEIEAEALLLLQSVVNKYELGLSIDQVQLKNVNPPPPVQASFNEVNQAQQEREQLINVANGEYNKVVPRARGEAEQKIQAAEGYALKRVNEAQGRRQSFQRRAEGVFEGTGGHQATNLYRDDARSGTQAWQEGDSRRPSKPDSPAAAALS